MNKLLYRFTFQWHITDICNLRCKHCYQDNFSFEGLSLGDLSLILKQLCEFVKINKITEAHINITGGEPFLRDDLIDLLIRIKKTGLFSFGILSNGYIPSKESITSLKSLKPRFVQISLEGKRDTNDSIRGTGSYNNILQSLKTYREANIPTMISFTANAKNYGDYRHVAKVARRYKATKIWTDRYLPNGRSDKFLMTTEQFKLLGELIMQEKQREKYHIFSKTEISSNRALQFLFCGGQPYRCSAGDTLLAILSNGDLLPCRRLPLKIGNLLTDHLINLYKNSLRLNEIRNRENLDKACINCYYKESCSGGLKCLSYILSGDYNKKDMNCWI